MTGPIIVDDVIYEKIDDSSCPLPSNGLVFRHLTFQRMEGLVQSEALLTVGGSQKVLGETEQKKAHSSSKARKRGNLKRKDPKVSVSDGIDCNL